MFPSALAMSDSEAEQRSSEEEALELQAKVQGFSDGFVEGMIQSRLAAAEFVPSELETLEMRRKREEKTIRQALQASIQDLKAGLAIFVEHAPEDEAASIRRLQAALAQPLKQEVVEASEEDRTLLSRLMPTLIETTRALLEEKHHAEAKSAALALCMLYPEVPHPYVLAGTALWYVDGLEVALQHYTLIIDHLFEQPMVNFFAADVFLAAGENEKCLAVLRRGLELCDADAPGAAEFKPQIEAFLAELAEKQG